MRKFSFFGFVLLVGIIFSTGITSPAWALNTIVNQEKTTLSINGGMGAITGGTCTMGMCTGGKSLKNVMGGKSLKDINEDNNAFFERFWKNDSKPPFIDEKGDVDEGDPGTGFLGYLSYNHGWLNVWLQQLMTQLTNTQQLLQSNSAHQLDALAQKQNALRILQNTFEIMKDMTLSEAGCAQSSVGKSLGGGSGEHTRRVVADIYEEYYDDILFNSDGLETESSPAKGLSVDFESNFKFCKKGDFYGVYRADCTPIKGLAHMNARIHGFDRYWTLPVNNVDAMQAANLAMYNLIRPYDFANAFKNAHDSNGGKQAMNRVFQDLVAHSTARNYLQKWSFGDRAPLSSARKDEQGNVIENSISVDSINAMLDEMSIGADNTQLENIKTLKSRITEDPSTYAIVEFMTDIMINDATFQARVLSANTAEQAGKYNNMLTMMQIYQMNRLFKLLYDQGLMQSAQLSLQMREANKDLGDTMQKLNVTRTAVK